MMQRKLEFCFSKIGSGEMCHSRPGMEGDSLESQWTKAVLTKARHCTSGSKMAPGWTTEWTLCEDGVAGGGGFACSRNNREDHLAPNRSSETE